MNGATLPLIAYAGIASSIVLSYLWIEGVKLRGPNRCSIFVNLLPILTALLAIACLHDTLHAFHLIGGGVSLLGVLLAQTLQRPLFARGSASRARMESPATMQTIASNFCTKTSIPGEQS